MIANGKMVALHIQKQVLENLKGCEKKVCFVLIGDNSASQKFVAMKCKFAKEVGVETKVCEYPNETTQTEAEKIITDFSNSDLDGLVLQLPLPIHLDTEKLLNIIPVLKDIDVLSQKAKNAYEAGEIKMVPPVARAVVEILNFYNIDLENKKILIVGKGRLVGEPVGLLLNQKGVDYSVVDIDTLTNISFQLYKDADIIISGTGSPHFIKPDMVKNGVVIVDAGTSRMHDVLVGDADPSCADKALLLTPVPGGVGPVTVASLFLNIL